jgi:iron(III) transport system permease protein
MKVLVSTGLFIVLLPLLVSIYEVSLLQESAWEMLQSQKLWQSVGGSLLLALSSGLAGAFIGVPAAYFLAKYKLPLNKFWLILLILPLVIPSYLSAYSYLAAFGNGGFFEQLTGVNFPLTVKGSLFGAWLSMTMVNFPFVFLMTYTAVLNLPASLEESAMSLGATRKEVFFTVILPNIKVPVISGTLMIALYSLSDFGTPAIMNYRTLTFEIFNYWDSGFLQHAAVFTILLIMIASLILLSEGIINRNSFYIQKDRNCTPSRRLRPSKKMQFAVLSLFTIITFFSLVIPIGTIFYWAFKGRNALKINDTLTSAISGSTTLAIMTALFTLFVALPIAWYTVRGKGLFSWLSDKIAFMGNMVPGVVIAVSLAAIFPKLSWGEWTLYGTIAMPVIGCGIRFLPQAVSALKTTLVQIAPSLEEASSILGQSSSRTLCKVTGPLILPGALAALALVFITTIKELPITLMMSPPGNKFLTQIIWDFQDDGEYSRIALPALFLLTISSLSLFFILKQNKSIEYE